MTELRPEASIALSPSRLKRSLHLDTLAFYNRCCSASACKLAKQFLGMRLQPCQGKEGISTVQEADGLPLAASWWYQRGTQHHGLRDSCTISTSLSVCLSICLFICFDDHDKPPSEGRASRASSAFLCHTHCAAPTIKRERQAQV